MYLVRPMPTQQNTADPSLSPTSEKEMTRPVCGWRIFCDRRGEQRYDSTASSMLSALWGRSLFMWARVFWESELVRRLTAVDEFSFSSVRGVSGPDSRFILDPDRFSFTPSRRSGVCIPDLLRPSRLWSRRRPWATAGKGAPSSMSSTSVVGWDVWADLGSQT